MDIVTGDLLVRSAGRILEIIFNRPQKFNAITPEMRDSLGAAIHRFAIEDELRVCLIRGTGKYFTSGVEIVAGTTPDFGNSTSAARRWYQGRFAPIFTLMEQIEKPIVVAHQGICLGGGLEMSLSCDFRFAARSASYRLPEVEIGVLPASGGISRLTRLVGPHWARWMVMAGESIGAEEAVRMGFVHRVYDDDVLEQEVRLFCERLAEMPAEMMALAKLSIEMAADLPSAEGRRLEQIAGSVLMIGDEKREYMQRFLDKQAAKRAAKGPR
jgi:enoyl-CoA hydratase